MLFSVANAYLGTYVSNFTLTLTHTHTQNDIHKIFFSVQKGNVT